MPVTSSAPPSPLDQPVSAESETAVPPAGPDAATGSTLDDLPRVACGVFGVLNSKDASEKVYLGLHALQHRGQDGCGIASVRGGQFHIEKHMGQVNDHFAAGLMARDDRLPGHAAIGHTRYTTQGKNAARNLQPFYGEWAPRDREQDGMTGMAIAHNGNLTNSRTLRLELSREGAMFNSETDTEVIVHLVAQAKSDDVEFRLLDALRQVEGGYAIAALSDNKLIAARDPNGIRPLVVGVIRAETPEEEDAYVVASETCALDIVGAQFLQDVRPGEMLVAETGKEGWRSLEIAPCRAHPRTCAFEYLYFAKPNSTVDGIGVYEARKRMGEILAEETFIGQGLEVDFVVPVPDSGMPSAMGFAKATGLDTELGIIRSHAVGRSFILADQETRIHKVRLKHSANPGILNGKRVVLVDDSIVRGTTSREIVKLVRDAGAKEIHFRSASPRIMYNDYYGIELSDPAKLFARDGRTYQEMAEELDVQSIGFLSVDGLYRAITGKPKDDALPRLCDHYFTGDFPTKRVDADGERMARLQLSLLIET